VPAPACPPPPSPTFTATSMRSLPCWPTAEETTRAGRLPPRHAQARRPRPARGSTPDELPARAGPGDPPHVPPVEARPGERRIGRAEHAIRRARLLQPVGPVGLAAGRVQREEREEEGREGRPRLGRARQQGGRLRAPVRHAARPVVVSGRPERVGVLGGGRPGREAIADRGGDPVVRDAVEPGRPRQLEEVLARTEIAGEVGGRGRQRELALEGDELMLMRTRVAARRLEHGGEVAAVPLEPRVHPAMLTGPVADPRARA
jgi:hypothetical protein